MKHLLLPLLFLLLAPLLHAQPDLKHSLYIKYKKCWPTISPEVSKGLSIKVFQHSNGNTYAILSAFDGSKQTNTFARLSKQHDTIWTKVYGGSKEDKLDYIQELPNGDIVLSGTSYSKDGDLWYARAFAYDEIWVMIVDTLGNIKRGRTFGGSGANRLESSITSSDGKIYMAGVTGADDYDFTHFQYSVFDTDLWYAKLDTNLNLIWVKVMSGNDGEASAEIAELSPSRLVVGVATSSTNTDFLPNEIKSTSDPFIQYIDSSGNTIWKHRYGGTIDNTFGDLRIDTEYKHIYVIGVSYGQDGDFSYSTTFAHSPPGTSAQNIYFIRLDTNGVVKQGKMYGPSAYTCPSNVWFGASLLHKHHVYATGTMVTGQQCSIGPGCGDADTNVNNGPNIFIAEVDSNCNLVGKYTVNGNGGDLVGLMHKIDNEVYFQGYSGIPNQANSFSCDTTRSFYFVAGLGEAPLGVSDISSTRSNKLFSLYPSFATNTVQVKLEPDYLQDSYDILVHSYNGTEQLRRNHQKGHATLDISAWAAGTYTLSIRIKKQTQTEIFLKR